MLLSTMTLYLPATCKQNIGHFPSPGSRQTLQWYQSSHQWGRSILLVRVRYVGEVGGCSPVLQTLADRNRVGGNRPSCGQKGR